MQQYQNARDIPSETLYQYLSENKENLINEQKLGLKRIPESPLGEEVRRRCIFDIKFLAHYFLWDVIPESDGGSVPVEKNIFLNPQYDAVWDLYVKKDPAVPIEKLSVVKTRLLLWPRGLCKSFSDHVDTYQWVICYPSVRILYLTAEASLSTGFMNEVKAMFTLREDTPSFSNLFFPEHCSLSKDMRKGTVFTTPAYKAKKTGRKEPTIVASSVGRNKSGWHYEVIKADDAVSDKNSQTETQCLSISEQLDLVENLLIPSGDGLYIQFIGTRYHEVDHYGKLTDKFKTKGEIEIVKEGTGWQFLHNKTYNVDIVIGKCCQIKPEVAERLSREGKPVTYVEAGEEGCILLVPNLMSYSFFMSKFTKNERVTEGQLNQSPQATSDIEFSKMLMLRATIPYMLMPRQGPVSQFWDFAFSKKKGRDYSTGTSVVWGEENELSLDGNQTFDSSPEGRKIPRKKTVGYARKVIRKRLNHLTLAQAIVQFAKEERPFVVGIEDASGSRLLEPTIIAEAIKTGDQNVVDVCSRIDWVTPDNQNDAKRVRIRSLYPWIAEGRFKFLNACMEPETMEVLYSEFEKCLVSHNHEDIPDSLSYQTRYAPRAVQAIVNNDMSIIVRIDQQGWGELFIEGYVSQGKGTLMQANSQGEIMVYDPYAAYMTPDDFSPAPEIENTTPNGMDNILGVGMWG